MTIRKIERHGSPVLVLDLLFRRKDGSKGRYRRDAQVQTMTAARAEERRLLANIAMYGEPFEPTAASVGAGGTTTGPTEKAETGVSFGEAVTLFRQGRAITRLKARTRVGYESILELRLLPRFQDRPIASIGFEDVTALDATMVEEGLSVGTRRNTMVTLRSVLSAAHEAGKLSMMPKLPRLPRLGKTVLRTLTQEQVDNLLAMASPPGRLAMALAAYAGLRSAEVRALRRGDVDLREGILVVRRAICRGIEDTPKSGDQRIVPIAKPLRELLERTQHVSEHVATTREGKVWGEHGLIQVLKRAAKRAKVGAWRFHDLRHFFVTHLFRAGIAAPTVQALAGHASLSVTQRYAHTTRSDLASACVSA